MRPLPSLSDIYLPEICERIAALPPRYEASEQQKQLIDLVEDDDFGRYAYKLQSQLLDASDTPSRAAEALNAFWLWLEVTAALHPTSG